MPESDAVVGLDVGLTTLFEEFPELSTPSVVVLQALTERDHASTAQELSDTLNYTAKAIRSALVDLCDHDLAVSRTRDTASRGRDPTEYEVDRRELSAALATDSSPAAKPRVLIIQAFAEKHYLSGLSSVTAKQLAASTPLSPSKVASRLRQLREDGVVERVGDTQRYRYRLVDVSDYAPFYATTDDSG